MTREVKLIGGPADGRTVNIVHGSKVMVPSPPDGRFTYEIVACRTPAGERVYLGISKDEIEEVLLEHRLHREQ